MRNSTLVFLTFFATVLFGLIACEGDQGPIGPAGPQGPTGATGENGAQNCMDCHSNSQLITAKLYQWEHSVHATGGHSSRNTFNCANCHTSQGFLQRVANGGEFIESGDPIEDPLPPNCYTCHQIHTTYTYADFAFTAGGPVTLWVGGETYDIGKGNQCLACHQVREYSPALPDPATGGTVEVTSSRYGPHHGPQGAMLLGTGGYELAGPMPYENSAHTLVLANPSGNGCVTCHMGPAQGVASGGHTFNVADENGNINTDACIQCHSDPDELEALAEDREAQIDSLLNELATLLAARGIGNPNDPGRNIPGTYTGHEAGAVFNNAFVRESRDNGAHNFKYAKALLVNSIEAMK